MLNISFNGIKNTLSSISLFNISFYVEPKKEKEVYELTIDAEVKEKDIQEYSDHKTTLTGYSTGVIEKLNDDLIVYLFIQKGIDCVQSHLVAPVIYECSTGRVIQYGIGWFALEGCGGGFRNTSTIFDLLKKHVEKGYKVSILPKVTDNKMLSDFEYVDSGITLRNVIDNSVDLINYQKDDFKWIMKKYNELIGIHKMNVL